MVRKWGPFKGSEVISDFSNVDTILFDKTGTLTEGIRRLRRRFIMMMTLKIPFLIWHLLSENRTILWL